MLGPVWVDFGARWKVLGAYFERLGVSLSAYCECLAISLGAFCAKALPKTAVPFAVPPFFTILAPKGYPKGFQNGAKIGKKMIKKSVSFFVRFFSVSEAYFDDVWEVFETLDLQK